MDPPSDSAAQAPLPIAAHSPGLVQAALALNSGRLPEAERLLKAHLKADPFDVFAIRMLAELAGRLGRYGDAEKLLRRAVELAPGFTAARANLALVLYRTSRPTEALAELAQVTSEDPDNPGHANLQAAAHGRIGAFEDAIALYEQVLAQAPNQPRVWLSFGHMLKTVGRLDEGIAAYRRAIALLPGLGEAWWSLANLKTVRFEEADIARMERLLERRSVAEEDRLHLEFALGKALEDRGDAEGAFRRYVAGNALRRRSLPYDASRTTRIVDSMITIVTPELFANADAVGDPAPDPIFIVGMPRAGSTLVEQILSSHSQVEGTTELPDLPTLAHRVTDYPAGLAALSPDERRGMGATYLARAKVQRRTERPFFIDKLPNNWLQVALIRLILPHATIIDARRHPLACGFSNFKQHFARGQGFSYSLADMGAYYRHYVRLMAHFDMVQPGRVHRVIYERMVGDTEAEVRALLQACGLPFEPACLAFHETARAVRTPSSEQVRRPIFSEGLEAWRPFAPWLGELEAALGPVLGAYPDAPPSAAL